MLEKVKNKLKNKGFWAGVLATLAGFIGGTMSAPDFFIQLINLIGG